MTLCTPLRIQATFHIATNPIYNKIITKPVPTAAALVSMDDTLIAEWLPILPRYFSTRAAISDKYNFARYALEGRYRNFRIIMYRPFVIRRALTSKSSNESISGEVQTAFDRCLEEARQTIIATEAFCKDCDQNRLGAWYAL